MTMKRRVIALGLTIVLLAMILSDFSLHLVELLGVEKLHPFYGFFWRFPNRLAYTVFWTGYWGVAVLFAVVAVLMLVTDVSAHR